MPEPGPVTRENTGLRSDPSHLEQPREAMRVLMSSSRMWSGFLVYTRLGYLYIHLAFDGRFLPIGHIRLQIAGPVRRSPNDTGLENTSRGFGFLQVV